MDCLSLVFIFSRARMKRLLNTCVGRTLRPPPLRQIASPPRSHSRRFPPGRQAALHCRSRRRLQHPYHAIRSRTYASYHPAPFLFPPKLIKYFRPQNPLRPTPLPPHHFPHIPIPLNPNPPSLPSPPQLHRFFCSSLPNPHNHHHRCPRPPNTSSPIRPPHPLRPAITSPKHTSTPSRLESESVPPTKCG